MKTSPLNAFYRLTHYRFTRMRMKIISKLFCSVRCNLQLLHLQLLILR